MTLSVPPLAPLGGEELEEASAPISTLNFQRVAGEEAAGKVARVIRNEALVLLICGCPEFGLDELEYLLQNWRAYPHINFGDLLEAKDKFGKPILEVVVSGSSLALKIPQRNKMFDGDSVRLLLWLRLTPQKLFDLFNRDSDLVDAQIASVEACLKELEGNSLYVWALKKAIFNFRNFTHIYFQSTI
ncbi:MAG: hypothetical protein WC843_01785 [Candidatus Gracilibacteria bacterium]|jgi:hypothetical protein